MVDCERPSKILSLLNIVTIALVASFSRYLSSFNTI